MLRIGKTNGIGNGVFATRDIRKGQILFRFQGKIIRDRAYARKLKCTLQIDKNLWINPLKGSFGRYINHSCNPNSGIIGKRTIIAIKNIKKGNQITIDYSITDDDFLWKMKCKCGSKNCRKIIRGVQYLPKNLFIKYKSFIPKFLQKSYFRYNIKTR